LPLAFMSAGGNSKAIPLWTRKGKPAMTRANDFTPTGLKLEGAWENDRNNENADLYKAIIREAYGVSDVICGHHLVYQYEDKRQDGFTYQVIEEIPSADTLIFDHAVAKKLWGEQDYMTYLAALACEPCETRDELLAKFFYGRTQRVDQGK
jgi:hypothetical protein